MVILALVIAVPLVLGSVSAVSARAAAPNDNGAYRFGVNYYYENGERYFFDVLDFIDNSTYADVASIEVGDPARLATLNIPRRIMICTGWNTPARLTPA
jgi:hypothetical protein